MHTASDPSAARGAGGARAAPPGERDRTGWRGVVLSGVAGAVDGIGYVVLHVFTAHVTGNTVHLGTAAGRRELAAASRPALAIAAFVGGVAIGALVRELCVRRGVRPRAAVLGVSAVLLGVFWATGRALGDRVGGLGSFALLVAPAALAMGCQNAVMPRVGGRRVRTYITGTVTELAEAAVAAALARGPERARSSGRARELLAVWFAYLLGGAVSGFAGARWGSGACVAPLAGLAAVVAADLVAGPRAQRR